MFMYILIGIAIAMFVAMLIFSATAYKRFVKAYQKHMKQDTCIGINGLQLANFMIEKLNLKTNICLTEKELADSFYSGKNIVLLSNKVAKNSTIASLAITAHEFGHAYQHKNKNFLFVLSNILAVILKIGKFVLAPLIISGIILLLIAEYNQIGQILLIISASLLILSYLLKLINIPVEFGASKFAYNFLKDNKILNKEELKQAKKILKVAGQTYIASLFAGVVKFFKKIGNSFRG